MQLKINGKNVRVCSKYQAPASLESITARLQELEVEKRRLIEEMKAVLLANAKKEEKIEKIATGAGGKKEFVFDIDVE